MNMKQIGHLTSGADVVGEEGCTTPYTLRVQGNALTAEHICESDNLVIDPRATIQERDLILVAHRCLQEDSLPVYVRRISFDTMTQAPSLYLEGCDRLHIPHQTWRDSWQVLGKVISIVRVLE
jgi:SOS-response transcriptional repressor LexA